MRLQWTTIVLLAMYGDSEAHAALVCWHGLEAVYAFNGELTGFERPLGGV